MGAFAILAGRNVVGRRFRACPDFASRAAGFSPRGFPGFEVASARTEPLHENGICSNRRSVKARNGVACPAPEACPAGGLFEARAVGTIIHQDAAYRVAARTSKSVPRRPTRAHQHHLLLRMTLRPPGHQSGGRNQERIQRQSRADPQRRRHLRRNRGRHPHLEQAPDRPLPGRPRGAGTHR